MADFYLDKSKGVLLKIARNHDDNDLLLAEAESLRVLEKIVGPPRDGVPALHNTFKVCGSGKWKLCANALTYYPGWMNLREVSMALGEPRIKVWVFKRLLSLLGWCHHLGVIHGAVLPQHILVRPDNGRPRDKDSHAIRLVDWCYSVSTKRTRLSAIVEGYEEFYAPEILGRKLTTTSDIYSAAKVIQSLGRMPDRLEKILEKCLDKNPEMRYPNAKSVFDNWVKASLEEFGKPKWVEFNV